MPFIKMDKNGYDLKQSSTSIKHFMSKIFISKAKLKFKKMNWFGNEEKTV